MRTRILNIVDLIPVENQIEEALIILNNSGVIAFPTETVYGLGCDIEDENALREIFRIKGRSFDKPLAAHISSLEQVENLCIDVPDEFFLLAENFLPGPLSVVLKKRPTVSDVLTANLDTIGIRFPNNSVCLSLIESFGRPIAGTSANLSGKTSPISATQVLEELDGLIPLIIDSGVTTEKRESTVISLVDKPKILRPGAIPVRLIEEVIHSSLQ